MIYHTDLCGLRQVLGEMRRVLAPGGEAFLTLNSRESDAYADPSWTRIDEYDFSHGQKHAHYFLRARVAGSRAAGRQVEPTSE